MDTAGRPEPVGTLFISHASEDKAFVDRLVPVLDQFAAKVWYDQREVLVGDRFVEKINSALNEASGVIAVLSNTSVKKPWVLQELNSTLSMQLQSRGILLFPVLINECDVPPLIAGIKYADFRSSFQTGLNELIAGLQGRGRRA